MAKSLNKVQLIGNLGRDFTMKYTPTGKAVAQTSMACNRSWNDANGERREHTEWVNIEAWGRAAEVLAQYTGKGDRIYVEGRLQTDRYRPEGAAEDKFFTKVVVNEFVLLGTGAGQRVVAEEPVDEGLPVTDEISF